MILVAKLINLSFHFIFFIKLAIKIFHMATTKKGKKTPQAKKGSKPKKNNKKNNLGIFPKIMLILLFLAVMTTAIFMIISNFRNSTTSTKENIEAVVKQEKKDAAEKKEIVKTTKSEESSASKKEVAAPKESSEKSETVKENNKANEAVDIKKTFKEENKLSGCWLSSEQGASLTIDDYGYRIDFFGVDASKPITGNYSIEKNLIIFTSDGSDCNGVDGSYRITFYKKNISLICKDDECNSRRNILEADWEWIEI